MDRVPAEQENFKVVHGADVVPSFPEPGLTRRVGAFNSKLCLVEHRMEKGWVGAAHAHPHEQVVYVAQGHLKVTCEGQTVDIRAGDSFVVVGGLEHQASAVEESLVIDIFTPCRKDYA
jgi:quercetin dioxygenase-like cupin family protein